MVVVHDILLHLALVLKHEDKRLDSDVKTDHIDSRGLMIRVYLCRNLYRLWLSELFHDMLAA